MQTELWTHTHKQTKWIKAWTGNIRSGYANCKKDMQWTDKLEAHWTHDIKRAMNAWGWKFNSGNLPSNICWSTPRNLHSNICERDSHPNICWRNACPNWTEKSARILQRPLAEILLPKTCMNMFAQSSRPTLHHNEVLQDALNNGIARCPLPGETVNFWYFQSGTHIEHHQKECRDWGYTRNRASGTES